jgi:50S ribosomal protein L16 3-hydroxylase
MGTMFDHCELTPQQFLDRYWQREPLLIRQAFPDFQPELDVGDIAGLACEELAESRLVTGSYPEHGWQLRYGPFSESDFTALPERDWTLLVQDVEKHYPPLSGLLGEFDFIPRWRIDDLMVSVAGPGGSVGPHVDQYDVFLIQAEGSRAWQIARTFDDELLPDCELNVLRSFSPEQEWTLETGDMLYLPPGVAHHGVALDRGMTWSVGMRAPSAADLYQAFGEWSAGQPGDGGRYRDPGLKVARHSGEIGPGAIARFEQLFHSSGAGSPDFISFLGSFLSTYRLAHEPAPPDHRFDPASLKQMLEANGVLRHNPWSRLLWLKNGDGAQVYAAGSEFSCPASLAETVCDTGRLSRLNADMSASELALVCELLNRGHLYVEGL